MYKFFLTFFMGVCFCCWGGYSFPFLDDLCLDFPIKHFPKIAQHWSGYRVAAWVEGIEDHYSIKFATQPPFKKEWSPIKILVNHMKASTFLNLAINAEGEATLIWMSQDDQKCLLLNIARLPLMQEMFNEVTTLSLGNEEIDPFVMNIQIEEEGHAVAVWQVNGHIYASTISAYSSSWTSPNLLGSSPCFPKKPPALTAHQEHALVVWNGSYRIENPEADELCTAKFSFKKNEWVHNHHESLIPKFLSVKDWAVALDHQGNASLVTICKHQNGEEQVLYFTLSPRAKSWSTPSAVSDLSDVVLGHLFLSKTKNREMLLFWSEKSQLEPERVNISFMTIKNTSPRFSRSLYVLEEEQNQVHFHPVEFVFNKNKEVVVISKASLLYEKNEQPFIFLCN